MAIYTPADSSHVEVSFALERIYQKRNGGSTLTVDFLVKNTGDSPVSRFQFLLPYTFLRKAEILRACRSKEHFEQHCSTLRHRQLARLRDATLEFLVPTGPVNWIYKVLGHVSIAKKTDPDLSRFCIDRSGQHHGEALLEGVVKRDWKISRPTNFEQDSWVWMVYALCGFSVFEYRVPEREPAYSPRTGEPREELNPNESMWLRLIMDVLPPEVNQHSMWRRIFARRLEFVQMFFSQSAVIKEARRRIPQCDASGGDTSVVAAQVVAARAKAAQFLPEDTQLATIQDWRTLLYREYGLGVERPDDCGTTPKSPKHDGLYALPDSADEPNCRRGPGPKWLRPFFRKERTDQCYEAWIGKNHDCDEPDGYTIKTTSFSGNVWEAYINWIGFIVGLLAFILAIRLEFLVHHLLNELHTKTAAPSSQVSPAASNP